MSSAAASPPAPLALAKPTPRQLAANRANALKSTGPRTPAGKLKVSQNAFKHGLCTQRAVLPGESEVDYNLLSAELRRDLRPRTAIQNLLLNRIVNVHWKLIRLQDAEIQLYELESLKAAPDDPSASDDPQQMTNDEGQMTLPRSDLPTTPEDFLDPEAYAPKPLYQNMFPCEVLARRFSDDPDNGFILLHRYEQSLQRELRSLLTRYHQVQKIWPTTPYDHDELRPREKQTQFPQIQQCATPENSTTSDLDPPPDPAIPCETNPILPQAPNDR